MRTAHEITLILPEGLSLEAFEFIVTKALAAHTEIAYSWDAEFNEGYGREVQHHTNYELEPVNDSFKPRLYIFKETKTDV